MSELSDEATILIVNSLPLRNLGLVTLLDRLSGTTKFRLASLTPDEAERWIDGATHCGMIIYNVGGASVGDHKHLKRIKGLRARAGEAPLVILSDNDSREEILSALGAGAQGFLYAGADAQLALQALCLFFKGGSYFPAAAQPRRRRSTPLNGTLELSPSPVASPPWTSATASSPAPRTRARRISISRKDRNPCLNVSAAAIRTRRSRASWESGKERLKSAFGKSCASPADQPYTGRHRLHQRRRRRNARRRSQHKGQAGAGGRPRSSVCRWPTARPEPPIGAQDLAWRCRGSPAPSRRRSRGLGQARSHADFVHLERNDAPGKSTLAIFDLQQTPAVMSAVMAQMAAMIRNVLDTPTVSANVPANGAPIRALPRMPMLYRAITRPRTSSRALSCRVLATVTLKKPQDTPSKNMPASAKQTPSGRASQIWTMLSKPHHAAIIITPGFTHEAISREPVTAPRPRHDITTPYSSLDPPSMRKVRSGTRTWKL